MPSCSASLFSKSRKPNLRNDEAAAEEVAVVGEHTQHHEQNFTLHRFTSRELESASRVAAPQRPIGYLGLGGQQQSNEAACQQLCLFVYSLLSYLSAGCS